MHTGMLSLFGRVSYRRQEFWSESHVGVLRHLRGLHTGPIIMSSRLVSKLAQKRRICCSKMAFLPLEHGADLKSAGRETMWVRPPPAPFVARSRIASQTLQQEDKTLLYS
jgi:hypothetical protein